MIAAPPSPQPLLHVEDLVTRFHTARGVVRAVDRVSFAIAPGRTLAVVGESGCGKSVTALSVMRLVPSPPGEIAGGAIRFKGDDLLALSGEDMRRIRGNQISMVFQEPMTSLNPVYTVGDQVAEAVRLHEGLSRRDAMDAAVEMFRLVGIPSPAERVRSYPHQLSGGMRQRVVIAMALACRPDLLIADEPTTALDVTIQAQILALLRSLQARLGMGIMLITHDLGVVAEICDEVIVMYAGRVVEQATTRDLFRTPRHPYTAGLLRSVPSWRPPGSSGASDVGEPASDDRESAPRAGSRRTARLREIPGMVPALHALPAGCKFQARCSRVEDRCRDEEPALVRVGATRVRCHFPLEAAA